MNISAVRTIFANSVKRWRNHRGLTQEELAERADLHRTYISDVERGARNLSLESIDKLAKALEISLPILFSPHETPGAAAVPRPAGSATEVVDILLAESNPADVDLTLDAFAKMRFANSVRVVAGGAEVLDLFFGKGALADQELRNQIILLDLDLPEVSGLEVLRQLKADQRTSNIPVVIIASSEKHHDVAEGKRLGAAAVLNKPLSFQALTKLSPALNLVWALIKPPPSAGALLTSAPV